MVEEGAQAEKYRALHLAANSEYSQFIIGPLAEEPCRRFSDVSLRAPLEEWKEFCIARRQFHCGSGPWAGADGPLCLLVQEGGSVLFGEKGVSSCVLFRSLMVPVVRSVGCFWPWPLCHC